MVFPRMLAWRAEDVKRWRFIEQVERLTALLHGDEGLPRAFLDLLQEHGIDRDQAALAALGEVFGGLNRNLCGLILTAEGALSQFDIDFLGEGHWFSWGRIETINRWEVSRVAERFPQQGNPGEVAMQMMREGRL